MAYKKLSDVDLVSSFDNVLVVSDGVVKQVSEKDINSHYNIDEMAENLYSVEKCKAIGIKGEAQGDLIFINDSSDGYLRGLNIHGKSTQDGTPTPAAPIDILNIGDTNNIIVNTCGRNLSPMSDFNSMFSNGASNTYNAETHTITMSEDVTSNTPSGRYCVPGTPKLKIGVVYTLSFDIRGTTGKIVSCGWDRNRTNVTLTEQFKRYEFTRVAESNSLAVSFYTINTADGGLGINEYIQFANVQIEIGPTATPYQKYEEPQVLNLSTPNGLAGIKVNSGGNYTDQNGQQWICDEIDLERGVYIQRIQRLVLNGTETWNKSSNGDNVYAYHMTLSKPPANAFSMSNKLVPTNDVNPLLVEGQTSDLLGYFVSRKYNVLYMNLGYYMIENTPEELQNVLSANPISIYYCMTEPIETPLSDVEISEYKLLCTKYLGTTIMNNAEVYMKANYNIDTKTYIDNKFEELKALIIA